MNTLPDLNTPLVHNLIRWAELQSDPSSPFSNWGAWDQDHWAVLAGDDSGDGDLNACGTAFCMAGQAVTQAGYRMRWTSDGENAYASDCIASRPVVGDDGRVTYAPVHGARWKPIRTVAMEVLGLTDAEARVFFDAHNALLMLKQVANDIAGARGIPALFPDTEPYDPLFTLHDHLDHSDGGRVHCLWCEREMGW